MFTNCFLRSMTEYFDKPASQRSSVTWDNLLNQAKQYTWDMTLSTDIHYYPVWEKGNCGNLIPQSVQKLNGNNTIDTSIVPDYKIDLKIDTFHTKRKKNPYDVELEVSSPSNPTIKIEKVVYYLHYTMENPIVTMTNASKDFYLSLAVWGGFPIKAKVYLSNGRIVELYKDIDIPETSLVEDH
jgi:hypothetical protein